jgi:hypothetical protein
MLLIFFHSYPHARSSLFQLPVELLGLSITVGQFLFTPLTGRFFKNAIA